MSTHPDDPGVSDRPLESALWGEHAAEDRPEELVLVVPAGLEVDDRLAAVGRERQHHAADRRAAGGAAEMRLVHFNDKTDVRSVPIGESTLEALANALFEPKEENPIDAAPITIEGTALGCIDGGRPLAHTVREEAGPNGRVTLTVAGCGTDNSETHTEHEPAVAAYLARKAEMMRRTAWVADAPGRRTLAVNGRGEGEPT